MILLNILTSQNIISKENKLKIEQELSSSGDVIIDDILSKYNVSDIAILAARNVIYNIPIYDGNQNLADKALYEIFPKERSEKYAAIPLDAITLVGDDLKEEKEKEKQDDFFQNKDIKKELIIGIVDPERKNVLDALQFLLATTGLVYKVYLISISEYRRRFFGYGKDNEGNVVKPNFNEDNDIVEVVQDNVVDITNEEEGLSQSLADTLPISKVFNIILKYAIANTASDIHIENLVKNVRIRIRIDGDLDTKFTLSASKHSSLIARVKILCSLRLDEKRKPQDGRFSVKYQGHKVDFRVSTMPAYYGEKVVIRILDSYKGVKALDEIGFSGVHMEKIRHALTRPYGMILISGPTGSGKSTTLYSMINQLDKDHKNIISLEDPIEFNIPGINQSQIFPEIDYTFATGLRSILRQDPDVIFVGEIRDAETAKLAIQASLTGHLVFSTIHTNNSIGVITRLLDMGIDPFLIAPTLNLAIAQRLVKKIAPGCSVQVEDDSVKAPLVSLFEDLPEQFKSSLPLDKNLSIGKGDTTYPTGLKGRIPVFEMLELDKQLQQMVIDRKNEQEIFKVAREKGFITMKEDGILKSINGQVPFTELFTL